MVEGKIDTYTADRKTCTVSHRYVTIVVTLEKLYLHGSIH